MIKYAERNFFTPIPQVASLAELNDILTAHCLAYQKKTQARQSQAVEEKLKVEQASLRPLPIHPPQCCRIVPVKANQSALVQFETNRYSVPCQWGYQSLWLKAFVDKIVITDETQVLAEHPRLKGRFEESICKEHYREAYPWGTARFWRESLVLWCISEETVRYPKSMSRNPI